MGVNNKNYIKGKSILYISAEEAQELLNEFAGKGNFADKLMQKEIVNFGKIIGEYIEEGSEFGIPTTCGKIHYGKNGAHIVPAKPKGEIK